MNKFAIYKNWKENYFELIFIFDEFDQMMTFVCLVMFMSIQMNSSCFSLQNCPIQVKYNSIISSTWLSLLLSITCGVKIQWINNEKIYNRKR